MESILRKTPYGSGPDQGDLTKIFPISLSFERPNQSVFQSLSHVWVIQCVMQTTALFAASERMINSATQTRLRDFEKGKVDLAFQ